MPAGLMRSPVLQSTTETVVAKVTWRSKFSWRRDRAGGICRRQRAIPRIQDELIVTLVYTHGNRRLLITHMNAGIVLGMFHFVQLEPGAVEGHLSQVGRQISSIL